MWELVWYDPSGIALQSSAVDTGYQQSWPHSNRCGVQLVLGVLTVRRIGACSWWVRNTRRGFMVSFSCAHFCGAFSMARLVCLVWLVYYHWQLDKQQCMIMPSAYRSQKAFYCVIFSALHLVCPQLCIAIHSVMRSHVVPYGALVAMFQALCIPTKAVLFLPSSFLVFYFFLASAFSDLCLVQHNLHKFAVKANISFAMYVHSVKWQNNAEC